MLEVIQILSRWRFVYTEGNMSHLDFPKETTCNLHFAVGSFPACCLLTQHLEDTQVKLVQMLLPLVPMSLYITMQTKR